MNGRLAGLAVAGPAPLLGPPVLHVASGEARAQRSRQRLALLEAALPGQGTLLLLVFPLLVLLLLFLHLGRRVKESRERGSRGQRRPSSPHWSRVPTCAASHSPARPRAGGGPGRGCPRRWPCGDPRAPRRGRSGARFGGHCTASAGWRRLSAGTGARLRRDDCGRGAVHWRGWPLPRPSRGLSLGRGPYPGPGRFGAV